MLDINRWVEMWVGLGGERGDFCLSVFSTVAAAYGEEQRRYHTADHVLFCLSEFDKARGQAVRATEAEAALWFHDVIYDPRGVENEEKSAAFAAGLLSRGGIAAEKVGRISALILDTRHKKIADSEDGRLVVDVDLAILGCSEAGYDRYERLIREEYAFVPEKLFREKRVEVLSSFLNQRMIYQTPFFRERYEEQARRNLVRAIQLLKESHGPP